MGNKQTKPLKTIKNNKHNSNCNNNNLATTTSTTVTHQSDRKIKEFFENSNCDCALDEKRNLLRIKRHFMLKLERRKILQKVLPRKEVLLSTCLGAGPFKAAPAANDQNHGIDGTEPLGNIPVKSIVNYHPTQRAI